MANANFPGNKLVLSSAKGGTANYILGSAHDTTVSAWAVQIVDTGSLSVSITVKARVANADTNADAIAFLATLYRKLYLNGAVADGSLVSTAITGNSLIVIPCSGLQVSLDVTFTSGTGTIYATPRSGSSVI